MDICSECGKVITFIEWTNGSNDSVGGEGWVTVSDGSLVCGTTEDSFEDYPHTVKEGA